MYICNNFKLYELVDSVTYSMYGNRAWEFFTSEILMSIDGVRDFMQLPVRVNNWFWGGRFQWRGARTKICKVGARKSEHRLIYYNNYPPHLCNAIDFDVKGMPAESVRGIILGYKDHELFQHINRMEKDTNWVHIDCKPVEERIKVFVP